MAACLNCFLVTVPTNFFVGGCNCHQNIIFNLLLFNLNTVFFVPKTLVNDFSTFLFYLFIVKYKLIFLRATTGPCIARLNTERATADQLGLSRSFGNLNDVFTAFYVNRFLFGSARRNNGIIVPCTVLNILILTVTIIFSHISLPRVRRRRAARSGTGNDGVTGLFTGREVFIFNLFTLLDCRMTRVSVGSCFVGFIANVR